METSNHEKRHIFLAVGIVLLIAGPFSLAFVPQTLTSILHYSKGDWHVFTPKESIISYGIAILLMFIACMVLFLLDIRKTSLLISAALVVLSITCIYFAAHSFKILSDERISFSPLLSLREHTYSWDNVEKLIRVEEGNSFSEYQLVFNDGKLLSLPYDAYFRELRGKFMYKIREKEIEIEMVKIE